MALSNLLMQLNEKEREKSGELEVAQKLVHLKRKRINLKNKENEIKLGINTGEFDAQVDSAREPQSSLSEDEISILFNITKYKQRLESLAYATGITAWKHENGEIHFTLDPYIRGFPRGPYMLRMRAKEGKMHLQGHNLPSAVPVKSLYYEYRKEQSQDAEKSLRTFLSKIMRNVKSYLSREDQVKELHDEDLGIQDIQALNHYTELKIVLGIKEDDESGTLNTFMVTISMRYDKIGERPIKGSLQVETDMDVDTETLLSQCQAFYTHRLKDAIFESF